MAQLPFPLSFKRQLPQPLEADTVFATQAELDAYLSSPLRYAGQIATCAETEGAVYVMSADLSRWVPVAGTGGGVAFSTLAELNVLLTDAVLVAAAALADVALTGSYNDLADKPVAAGGAASVPIETGLFAVAVNTSVVAVDELSITDTLTIDGNLAVI